MLIVAEAIGRGNSKTDGFKSRIVPVPKAMIALGLRGRRPVEVAAELMQDIAAIDQALRNGLALVAAGGNRDKVGKEQYARAKPARDALARWVDAAFFDELWARAILTSAEDLRQARLAFLNRLFTTARAEFAAALPAVPCASLMRPRAETRGRTRLERDLYSIIRPLQEDHAHV